MAIFGSLPTVRAQLMPSNKFDSTFAYLDDCFRPGTEAFRRVRQISTGEQIRTEISGGAFALEQTYNSKARSEGFFESHKLYIDVQVIVEGSEFIEVIDVARLKLKEDRTPAKDLLVYEMVELGVASPLRLDAGDGAILFPVDGHMPGLLVSNASLVRKIVVKVPVL